MSHPSPTTPTTPTARAASSRRASLWPWIPVLSTAAALSILLVLASPLPLH